MSIVGVLEGLVATVVFYLVVTSLVVRRNNPPAAEVGVPAEGKQAER